MFLDRFCASCIMMATYRRLNRQKEELCKREGIDQRRRAEFRDIGDASPLFRCVSSRTFLMLYNLNLTILLPQVPDINQWIVVGGHFQGHIGKVGRFLMSGIRV